MLAIGTMFALFIAPTFIIINDFRTKSLIYDKKIIGLQYASHFNKLIAPLQLHRGALNGYLNGYIGLLKDIEKSQKNIQERLTALIELNNHYSILEDKEFDFVIKTIEDIKFENIATKKSSGYIFILHSNIISELIRLMRKTSSITHLAATSDSKLAIIGVMITNTLPTLQELSGQLRGHSVGILAKDNIANSQKIMLLSLINKIDRLFYNIAETFDLYDIEFKNEHLDKVLNKTLQIRSNIELFITYPNISILTPRQLFSQATSLMNKQIELQSELKHKYISGVQILKKDLLYKFIFLLTFLIIALIFALYISSSLYISILSSLKKLSNASKRIGDGELDIQIEVNLKDEIGEALMAFNSMSYNLAENITFLDRYKMAIDETSIVLKTNKDGIITYVNKKFCDTYGYAKEEIIGKPHNILKSPSEQEKSYSEIWNTIGKKEIWRGIIKNLSKDNKIYISETTIIPMLDTNGNILEHIEIRHDITELERFKKEIEKHNIDLLTGLPNRNKFLEEIENANNIGIIYLNINNFSGLNQFYGFKVADRVLIGLSTHLSEMAKEFNYKLYRLRSDDFLIMFTQNRLNTENYKEITERIIDKVESREIECGTTGSININLTSGIVLSSSFRGNKNLLAHAEQAKKIAKIRNKKYLLYNTAIDKGLDYKKNIKYINEIKNAIKNDMIKVYFQPIVDNTNGKITKYEALVRLIKDDGEVLSPYFFLDIAVKANLYAKITRIVINKSFEKFHNLPYILTINLSIEDINNKETLSFIFNKLKSYPNPENIVFEILESQEIKDYIAVKEFVKKVKKIGAKIAIDDFGSGYSNFEHIINIGADFIKIDGSLIKNIDCDKNSQILVKSIINLSKNLGIKTIAEFVCSKDIYDIVQNMEADFSQGYYLGEPRSNLV